MSGVLVRPPVSRKSLSWGTCALFAWAFLAATVVLVTANSDRQDNFRESFTWLAVALACGGIVGAKVTSRSTSLALSLKSLRLGPWFCLGFAVVFGGSSFVWLGASRPNYITDEWALIKAEQLALAGLAAFVAAYMVAPRSLKLPYRPRRALGANGPTARTVVTFWLIAVSSELFSISTGSFGYLSPAPTATATTSVPETLALLQNLGYVASLLAGWRLAKHRTGGTRVLLAVVLTSQIGLSLFAGLKEPALTQMVAAFAGYAVVDRVRVKWLAAGLATFVIGILPFVTIYRAEVSQGAGRLSPAQAISQISFGGVAQSARAQSSQSAPWDQLSSRLSRIGDLAIIVQKTPSEIPYAGRQELFEAPVLGVVPRSVWPGKPVLIAGQTMARDYYGSTASTSAAVTPEGDLWRHGGLIPVLVGMSLLGLLVASIDRREGNLLEDPRMLFLPLLLFDSIVKEESDFVGLLASLATTAIISAFAVWLVGKLSEQRVDARDACVLK